ncbi:hypothetical protein CANARDRAFT_200742 [[Candida] arabinofermentans NRRL YB-2248]|uniref:Exocyst complex subunit Exo70 C-terminal domain-containing protein n=1 Tax=[Candida] arabinofermentans NRRL YB-2248 TaxID=983967 RepID=A0A1E4SY85_9ASCO|nr:hypothetical protein CANARDRAFT_200742 [[Candida] arabinofermentans NRRL YB-2248]
MLTSEGSNSYLNGSDELNKVVIDVDEADLSVLEENLKLTNELTNKLAINLREMSELNYKAVKSVNPLMLKINRLKIQQKNFQSTLKLVDDIKGYAQHIKTLDKSLNSCGDLNTMAKINSFCSIVTEYQSLRKKLEARRMNDFEGLVKGLNDSIRDSDVTLKFEFIGKLKTLGKNAQSNEFGDFSKEDQALIRHLALIQSHMHNIRGKSLIDTVIKERADFNLKILRSKEATIPNLVKDQNYLYDGDKSSNSFLNYSMFFTSLMTSESDFLSKFLTDFSELRQVLAQIFKSCLDEYTTQFNKFSTFVENHKLQYGTMMFEIRKGVLSVVSRLTKFGISPPTELSSLVDSTNEECRAIFGYFFKFIEQRYSELILGDQVSETLNNTFMSIVTRMVKLSSFGESLLEAIQGMPNGSWLPSNRPFGFQEVKTDTRDPNYLLSIYFGDIIELNYYHLENKYKPKMPEEDLGIMLMFNLDGLQNLIESSNSLRHILGQQGVQRYEKLKKKTMEKATSGWTNMTTKLMRASTKQGANLNASTKELKILVDEFNRDFDENFKKIQNKKLPPFFKKQLVQDINMMLAPAYRVFYTNLSADSSTKSILKHLKYDVNTLQNKITSIS